MSIFDFLMLSPLILLLIYCNKERIFFYYKNSCWLFGHRFGVVDGKFYFSVLTRYGITKISHCTRKRCMAALQEFENGEKRIVSPYPNLQLYREGYYDD